MNTAPLPVVCEPLFKPKPWGGRRLADLFDKPLPADETIGESWELVSLPENESHVLRGPLAGRSLSKLVSLWGDDLLGGVDLVDQRFPLLIKFLDACENLSVQVHPKPADDDPLGRKPGIKHEAWYVLHADPGAKLYIGLKPGVTPADVAQAANTPAMVNLLEAWEGTPGQCYYLPSGTLHALGAGLVVAEIQTPSDITYRAYDWGRVGLDGQPRELHIDQSLSNIRYDVTREMIHQPARQVAGLVSAATRAAECDRFTMDMVRLTAGLSAAVPTGELAIWMVLRGAGCLHTTAGDCPFAAGDTVLLPAAGPDRRLELTADTEWVEVRVPRA